VCENELAREPVPENGVCAPEYEPKPENELEKELENGLAKSIKGLSLCPLRCTALDDEREAFPRGRWNEADTAR